MNAILRLDRFGLKPDGPTLSLELVAGQTLAVVGPAGAGKSRFVSMIAGDQRAAQGQIELNEPVVRPEPASRRSRVQAIARHYPDAAPMLAAAGLLADHARTMSDLSPGQRALIELLPALFARRGLAIFDGDLDRLDPWLYPMAMDHLRRSLRAGMAVVTTTNRSDILQCADLAVVLIEQEAQFAGTIDDLLSRGRPHEVVVESTRQEAVRALVDPLEVRVNDSPNGLRMETTQGQETAARMLLEGYGDVRLVYHRAPTIEEALRTYRS